MGKRSRFHKIAGEIANLVVVKNKAYGDSFNKCSAFLKLLWPDGVPADSYSDMLAIVRVFDKFMRIATDKDALEENPWRDIFGYALLAVEGQTRGESDEEPPEHLEDTTDSIELKTQEGRKPWKDLIHGETT